MFDLNFPRSELQPLLSRFEGKTLLNLDTIEFAPILTALEVLSVTARRFEVCFTPDGRCGDAGGNFLLRMAEQWSRLKRTLADAGLAVEDRARVFNDERRDDAVRILYDLVKDWNKGEIDGFLRRLPLAVEMIREMVETLRLEDQGGYQVAAETPAETTVAVPPLRKKNGRRTVDWEAAEDKARRYLYTHRRRPNRVTLRELAKAVGLSEGSTIKLTAWQDELEKRGLRSKVKQPKAVSMTHNLEASVGDDSAELRRLITEQQADDEPSPLDLRPKKVRPGKRV